MADRLPLPSAHQAPRRRDPATSPARVRPLLLIAPQPTEDNERAGWIVDRVARKSNFRWHPRQLSHSALTQPGVRIVHESRVGFVAELHSVQPQPWLIH